MLMQHTAQFGFAMIALPIAGLLACCGCAGYQFGAASLYRPDIHTVYVPIFESNTYRRYLGERLTEAVIKEIEENTTYKVVHTPDADSVLTGRIMSSQKRVLVETINDEPRDVDVNFQVQINWTDRAGNVITQNATPLVVANDTNFLPEGGQSISSAQQQAFQELAREIVNQMQMPW